MDRDAALRRIEQALENAYDEGVFRSFVREFFSGAAAEENKGHVSGNRIFGTSRGDKYDAFRDNVVSYKRIAKYTDSEDETLDVLAVKLHQRSTLERARTLQRDFVAENLRRGDHSAALVAFYTDEAPQWRLSLVRLEYRQKLDDTGKVKVSEELTPAKRYSFRVGEDEPLRTTKEQLLASLLSDEPPTLEAVDDAFSVEPVTREFFKDYDRTFKEAEQHIQGFDDEDARWLFAQRTFNRLLFIRFLEKKGWLQLGDARQQGRDYLLALWQDYRQREGETESGNFYDDRLRPLFFQGLNEEQEQAQDLIGQVPYLNGELFEPDADDRRDGLHIPDEALRPIFEGPRDDDEGLFYRYNFTVAESTPLDVEVAVDPEMLGKVFERLVNARGETGSYYTPKPVVAFMCREALKGYLGKEYADLVDRHDPKGIEVKEARALIEKLAAIKVVDPACGSGAYLLGMLHELHALYRLLDTRAGEATPRDDYERKLNVIRDNLYGVDIDRFAVNIAQLRLWLSLVIEYEGDAPEPLPNLHFSIGCGDSLTAPSPASSGNLFRSAALPKIRRLERLKGLHQRAHGERKRKLEGSVHEAEAELTDLLDNDPAPEGAFDWRVRFAEVFTEKPAGSTLGGELNMGQELAPPLREGGFDVVLANPPYRSTKRGFGKKHGERFSKQYETASGQYDAYELFIERAFSLMRPGGVYAYIVPKPVLTNSNMKRVRTVMQEHRLDAIADPGRVFDASVEPVVIVGRSSRSSGRSNGSVQVFAEDTFSGNASPLSKSSKQLFTPLGTWNIKPPAMSARLAGHMNTLSTLKDYFTVTRGVECGKSDDCISSREHPGSHELLRGEDVEAYSVSWKGLFISRSRESVRYKSLDTYKSPKLLVRRVASSLMAAMDYEGRHVLNTLYVAHPKPNTPLSLEYLCAVLNSQVVNDYFREMYVNDDKLFPYIRKGQLVTMPIAMPAPEQHRRVEELVRALLEQGNSSDDLTDGLDELMLEIYHPDSKAKNEPITAG